MMVVQHSQVQDRAYAFACTARDAFKDQAEYFHSLPEDAWEGPTGCAQWTMQDLARHIVGEVVWFPNLVRGVTDGEPALPVETWEELKRLPGPAIAARMAEAGQELIPAVENATTKHLEKHVDFGPTQLPLWQVLGVCLLEAVVHNWDARVGREPRTTISTPWARELAGAITLFAPMLAHADALFDASGRYLLEVGDGVGPITVTVREHGVRAQPGRGGIPDVTVLLTADQYVRLLTGRFRLGPVSERAEVEVEAEQTHPKSRSHSAEDLNRIFAGVGH